MSQMEAKCVSHDICAENSQVDTTVHSTESHEKLHPHVSRLTWLTPKEELPFMAMSSGYADK